MEPFLVDGAWGTIPLSQFLAMSRAARKMMAAALSGDGGARQNVETVFALALRPGPQQSRATLSAYLLRDAMTEEQERRGRGIVEAPQPPQQQEYVAEPVPAQARAQAQPVCGADHPSDIVCELCPPERVAAQYANRGASYRASA